MSLAARFFDPSQFAYCQHRLFVNAIPSSLLNSGLPADWQIDGNLGQPAGIAEALLQSHEMIAATNSSTGALVAVQIGYIDPIPLIRLLPTLPPAWVAVGGAGHVTGLRARGGFTVSIQWDAQGKLTQATVVSEYGGPAYVTLGTTVIGATGGTMLSMKGAKDAVFVRLDAKTGGKYVVKLA